MQNSQLFGAPHNYYRGYETVKQSLKDSTHKDYHRALVKVRNCLPKTKLWFFNLDAALFSVTNSLHRSDGSPGARQMVTKRDVRHRTSGTRDEREVHAHRSCAQRLEKGTTGQAGSSTQKAHACSFLWRDVVPWAH